MTAYTTSLPAGIAGEVTRDGAVIFNAQLDADIAAGSVVKIVTNKAVAIASGDAAADVFGITTRSAPAITDASTGNLESGNVAGVLRKGFINVVCKQGTPAIGGAVYVRITADTGKLVGDIETTADSAKCVAIAGAVFAVAGKDSSNVTEIFLG